MSKQDISPQKDGAYLRAILASVGGPSKHWSDDRLDAALMAAQIEPFEAMKILKQLVERMQYAHTRNRIRMNTKLSEQ